MKKALLIASSAFEPDSGIEPLRYPVDDILAMERVLKSEDFNFDIAVSNNEDSQTLRVRLDTWMADSSFDDMLLLYFSGHGKLNATGDLFLTCRDTKERALNATGLKWSYILDLVNDHARDRIGIILDCCYAGKALTGVMRGGIEDQVRANASESGRGIIVLGASGATQTAEEREADGQGIFTKQIVEGLTTGSADVNGDGQISFRDLAEYVKREFAKKGITQRPIEGGVLKAGDLIVGSSYKKPLMRDLETIKARIKEDRDFFQKKTYRAIEDYLDDAAANPNPNLRAESKFRELLDYSKGPRHIEKLIEAFREHQAELPRQRSSNEAFDQSSLTARKAEPYFNSVNPIKKSADAVSIENMFEGAAERRSADLAAQKKAADALALKIATDDTRKKMKPMLWVLLSSVVGVVGTIFISTYLDSNTDVLAWIISALVLAMTLSIFLIVKKLRELGKISKKL